MANDLTSRPLKYDTAVAGLSTFGRPLRVKKIYWENPTTAAHTFVITDASDKVLLEGRCEVINQSQVFDFEPSVNWKAIKVPTIASGILWIYTE